MDTATQIAKEKEGLLPLDVSERVVVFELEEDPSPKRHIFSPATVERARDFYRQAQRAADMGQDQDEALLALYADLVRDVQGYRVRDGASLASLPNWKERVPLSHRLRAVQTLMAAAIDPQAGQAEIDPEFDTVVLRAPWTAAPEASGRGMLSYSGLVHRFEVITAEDRQAFRRDRAKGVVVGGSRTGQTLYPAPQNLLLRIYDRKVRAVEGYAMGGRPLGAAEEIVAHMDPFHKVSALLPLFNRFVLNEKREEEPDNEELARAQSEVQRIEEGR